MTEHRQQPVVMSVAELDPSGAGGLAADIETLNALGCHCTPVVSAISVQDTQDIKDIAVIESLLVMEQMRAVLEDMPVKVLKLHQLASTGHLETIHTVLEDYPRLTVILDPSLSPIQEELDFNDALRSLILPRCDLTVLTEREAFTLAPGSDTLAACVHQLTESSSGDILINDVDPGKNMRSRLFRDGHMVKTYSWETLPQHFLGAGSTFAAAIAAGLAHGLQTEAAIRQAQEFTWLALQQARRLGMGKLVPDRQFSRNRSR